MLFFTVDMPGMQPNVIHGSRRVHVRCCGDLRSLAIVVGSCVPSSFRARLYTILAFKRNAIYIGAVA